MTFTAEISGDIVRKRQNSRNNLVEKFIAIAWNSIMIQRRNICFNHIAMRNSANAWVCWSSVALIGFDFNETEFFGTFFWRNERNLRVCVPWRVKKDRPINFGCYDFSDQLWNHYQRLPSVNAFLSLEKYNSTLHNGSIFGVSFKAFLVSWTKQILPHIAMHFIALYGCRIFWPADRNINLIDKLHGSVSQKSTGISWNLVGDRRK